MTLKVAFPPLFRFSDVGENNAKGHTVFAPTMNEYVDSRQDNAPCATSGEFRSKELEEKRGAEATAKNRESWGGEDWREL